MGTHQDYYNSFKYVYEVFIVNSQTYEKKSIGFFDKDTYQKFMDEFLIYLQDYKQFYWMTEYHRVDEHHDDILERADKFIRNSLYWETDRD